MLNGIEGELTGQSPVSQEAIFLKLLSPLSHLLSLPTPHLSGYPSAACPDS